MTTIDFLRAGSFPIVIAFSGGKDSVAMVLHLLEQRIDRERIHLHHHDVDGGGERLFDWRCTQSYCKAFANAFGLQLFFSYRQGGILREIYRNNEPRQDLYFQFVPGGPFSKIPSNKKARNTRLKFPAVSADLSTRWCSGTVKIDVLASVIRRHPAYRHEVYILTGERRHESTARHGYKELDVYPASTQYRRAILWRPVIDWTETMVWKIMGRWHVQPHPAYMLGWNRCSCQLCIFGSPNIWATIQVISPEKVKAVSRIERNIGFTLYNKQGIYERVFAGQPFDGLSTYWIAQATGEFTAPIIINPWVMPPGAFKKESAGAV